MAVEDKLGAAVAAVEPKQVTVEAVRVGLMLLTGKPCEVIVPADFDVVDAYALIREIFNVHDAMAQRRAAKQPQIVLPHAPGLVRPT